MPRDTRGRSNGASGRFVLRLSGGLHAALRAAARDAGVSLNDYCARKLALPAADPASPGATVVVERAAALVGEHLVGVVAYGSWVRGDATAASDVDVLIVLHADAPLTRALYRRWDAEPVTWDRRPVEPHFVRLRRGSAPATGLWAEAALDGVVLFERGFAVSKRLAAVRRDIVAGRLVRRLAHGQPYWAEVA